jgi:hypothetical protein
VTDIKADAGFWCHQILLKLKLWAILSETILIH